MAKKKLGRKWSLSSYAKDRSRFRADQDSTGSHKTFDELVIDDWFHMERMNDQFYWLRIGDVAFELKWVDGKYVLRRQDTGEVIR